MPQRGICKLCRQEKDLCDSHYLPKALYRRLKREGGGDPIIMTPNLVVSSSRQVRDFVFCAECEQRLNLGGEQYAMSLVANGNGFPLRDMFSNAPIQRTSPFLRLPGKHVRLDTTKLAHFAIGLLWKGAVHSWQTVARQTTKVRPFPIMENVRRYLLNEESLPDGMLVFVMVCLDGLSQTQSNAPYLVGGYEAEHRYEMLIKGIRFHIAFDRPQKEIDQFCCVHSGDHAIFATDCHDSTLSSVKHFYDMARHAKNLP